MPHQQRPSAGSGGGAAPAWFGFYATRKHPCRRIADAQVEPTPYLPALQELTSSAGAARVRHYFHSLKRRGGNHSSSSSSLVGTGAKAPGAGASRPTAAATAAAAATVGAATLNTKQLPAPAKRGSHHHTNALRMQQLKLQQLRQNASAKAVARRAQRRANGTAGSARPMAKGGGKQ